MTELTAPHISEYLAESQRRANTTSEQEARAQRADAFESELAAIGERGFFGIARMRTDTEQLLFDARSKAHELNQRDDLGMAEFKEKLLAECLWLCGRDELKAKLLASAVLGS